MPLMSAPSRGYTDWQRVENWDSGVLFSNNGAAAITGDGTGLLDVSRYAYLSGFDEVTGGNVQATYAWFADAAGLVGCGGRTIMFEGQNSRQAQYRLPNLGPYVQIGWQLATGASFNHTCVIMATNRAHPLEMIPGNSLLIYESNFNLPAGDTFLYPGTMYTGPVQIWTHALGASVILVLQMMLSNGTYDAMIQLPGANGEQVFNWTAPQGAWRLRVANSGAAVPGVYLMATASLTGAT